MEDKPRTPFISEGIDNQIRLTRQLKKRYSRFYNPWLPCLIASGGTFLVGLVISELVRLYPVESLPPPESLVIAFLMLSVLRLGMDRLMYALALTYLPSQWYTLRDAHLDLEHPIPLDWSQATPDKHGVAMIVHQLDASLRVLKHQKRNALSVRD